MSSLGEVPSHDSPEFEVWVKGLSMKKLKAFITSKGMGYGDCLEKAEFRARAREAAAKAVPVPAKPAAGNNDLVKRMKTFSDYECEVHAPESVHEQKEKADFVVVFLHGYGATADNVAVLAQMSTQQSPLLKGKRVCWVFPQAPAIGGAPAWWQIDVMQWMMAMQNPAGIAKMIRQQHPGLPECRERMNVLVEQVLTMAGVSGSYSRLLLGGFSQGAMTALDCAVSLPSSKRPAGVLSISGAPIVVEEWAVKAKQHKDLRVLITHGESDQVLFYQGSLWLRDLLTQAGMCVKHSPHEGGHDFGDPRAIVQFVDEIAAEACAS